MPDRTPDLLPTLETHRLPGLDLPDGLIHPKYDGGSILNLPATIAGLFGAPPPGDAGPLAPMWLEPLQDLAHGADRVVMVLMDALALHRLRAWIADGRAPLWARLAGEGFLAPLTSVVPSTTSTALPTIWSGLSPAEHGLVGYELWLKEYGVVANMITHAPFRVPGRLDQAGFKPEKALPGPTLGWQLAQEGVKTFAFQHYTIANSGMSRMFLKDVQVSAFGGAAELMANLRVLIEDAPRERRFFWVYWSGVDSLSHTYGPDDERPAFDFFHFNDALEQFLIDRLAPEARSRTLLLLVADHGQIHTPKEPYYDLSSHPGLARRLPISPTGENRLVYFHVRPGQMEAVREYLDRTLKGRFAQLDPGHAVENGLFGPGDPHPRLRDRLGDLLAVSLGDAFLWWGDGESPIFGRHGGMTAEEMLVPLLAARL
ncbi:MAG TPA: alkaline phosphatase family protein [Anaerolineales bacterium]|nr:alkaline phosphatase family protein [Anaerolineales bacterium]